MDALFPKSVDILSRMLDYRSRRHLIISSNVANLDTPDYRPQDLRFKGDLRKALQSQQQTRLTPTEDVIETGKGRNISRTHPLHLPEHLGGSGDAYQVNQTGDKVKLDVEMANIAENQLMYNMTVEMLVRKLRGIKSVLTEAK